MPEYVFWMIIAVLAICWLDRLEEEENALKMKVNSLRNYLSAANTIRHVPTGKEVLFFDITRYRRKRPTITAALINVNGRHIEVDISNPDKELTIEGYVEGSYPPQSFYLHRRT